MLALTACGGGGGSSISFSSSTGSSDIQSSDTGSSSSIQSSDTGSSPTSDSSEKEQTVTIYYDLGECSNATITALTQTVEVGKAYTLYVPYLDESKVTVYGYDFIKWLNKADNSEFTSGVCDFTEDIYLIAVWEKYTPDIPL